MNEEEIDRAVRALPADELYELLRRELVHRCRINDKEFFLRLVRPIAERLCAGVSAHERTRCTAESMADLLLALQGGAREEGEPREEGKSRRAWPSMIENFIDGDLDVHDHSFEDHLVAAVCGIRSALRNKKREGARVVKRWDADFTNDSEANTPESILSNKQEFKRKIDRLMQHPRFTPRHAYALRAALRGENRTTIAAELGKSPPTATRLFKELAGMLRPPRKRK